ncbi:Hypothetical protein NTJ_10594 [Nesidiocoris tenuis]|uniref:Ubiquitin-like domain-containing protein n=1 Tax=Nesidiocoris tenuis TaxID=355587 RepID=A0ABN7B0L5_9HEMI|nr:Hypothetical protein NTJ_10594 [Nesidiocoris tenuis]
MKLNVKSLSDGSQPMIGINVSCDTTVDHFRTLVAKALAVSADQVRLVFAGQILENGKPLSAFDLFENASIISIINKNSAFREQMASAPESTDCYDLMASSGNTDIHSAKRPKLDGLAESSLVTLVKELIGQACEFSSDRILLKHDSQLIDDDKLFFTHFPQASMTTETNTTSQCARPLEKISISSNSRMLAIRITRELKTSNSLENIYKSFDMVCEIEKNDSLIARIIQVSPVSGSITLSSIPSSKPNGDHPIVIADVDIVGNDTAEMTYIFLYDGDAKFIRNLIAKEFSVKTYSVFLEMNDSPVHDEQHVTAYCIHNRNVSCHDHRLHHRIFRSPIEEVAWRMNNDVCSKSEFLSYMAGLPEIQPFTADPKNIRKMLLTHPLLKRVYKQSPEINRILHWDDYLLYRMNNFKNPDSLPSLEHIMLDPVGWNQLMVDWPVVQQLYRRYPEIRHILMWEEYLSYRTNLMTNPSFLALYREVVRNQDRVMAQYERYSEYSNFMLNVNQDEAESLDQGNLHDPSSSEVYWPQSTNNSISSDPVEEIRSSEEDLKTYIANISKFASKLLKYCPQFNDAFNFNPFMQSFMDNLARDSRLIEGIIEEATPEVKNDPIMLSWAKEQIPKIMRQICDPEGLEELLRAVRDDDFLDPASQVKNALDVLRRAGYPVSEILDPSDQQYLVE